MCDGLVAMKYNNVTLGNPGLLLRYTIYTQLTSLNITVQCASIIENLLELRFCLSEIDVKIQVSLKQKRTADCQIKNNIFLTPSFILT